MFFKKLISEFYVIGGHRESEQILILEGVMG
jgi:hypothetical protein